MLNFKFLHSKKRDTFLNLQNNESESLLQKLVIYKFTRRDLDIVASLYCGRSSSIPSFLNVSKRTLEGYIYQITKKVGCNSREGIIDFVEKKNYISDFKRHYTFLLVENNFTRTLKEIEKKFVGSNFSFFIKTPIDRHYKKNYSTIIKSLIAAGIKISYNKENSNYICFSSKNNVKISFNGKEYDLVFDPTQYYDFIFSFLKIIYTSSFIIEKRNSFIDVSSKIINENSYRINNNNNNSYTFIEMDKIKKNLFIFVFAMFLYFLFFFIIKENKNTVSNIFLSTSDAFIIPRKSIQEQIKKTLSRTVLQNNTAILFGSSGSGKTTIARLFAKNNNYDIIWEINAEDLLSIKESFKQLAIMLSNTKEEKDELNKILSIFKGELREIEILKFVKFKLKIRKWLFIYDNLNKFHSFSYFPFDKSLWGIGDIIISTNQYNVIDNNIIDKNSIVYVNELLENDAISFFYDIYQKKKNKEIKEEDKVSIKDVLKYIPKYPLDILIVSKYLKNNDISLFSVKSEDIFNVYIDKESTHNLLNSINYFLTRKQIIFKILDEYVLNQEQMNILFQIYLFNNNNIFLKSFHKFNINKQRELILLLKRFSIIDLSEKTGKIFLHRAIQEIIGEYIFSHCSKEEQINFFYQILSNIDLDISLNKNLKNIENLYINLIQCKRKLKILSFEEKHTNCLYQHIFYLLGFCHIFGNRNIVEEKKYFEESYKIQLHTNYFNQSKTAKILQKLGEIYSDSQNHKKCIYFAQRSIDIYEKLKGKEYKVAENLYNIAQSNIHQNNFREAILHIDQGLSLLKRVQTLREKETLSSLYALKGYIFSIFYINQDKGKQGISFVKKALKIHNYPDVLKRVEKGEKIPCCIVRHLHTLSDIYMRYGIFDSDLEKSLNDTTFILNNKLDKCPHLLLNSYVDVSVGYFLLYKRDYTSAAKYFKKAIKDFKKILGENNYNSLTAKLLLAETLFKLNKLKESYDYSENVLQYRRRIESHYHQLVFLHAKLIIGLIHIKQNDLENALKTLNLYLSDVKIFGHTFFDKKLYDQIFNSEKIIKRLNISKEDEIKFLINRIIEIISHIYSKNHNYSKDFINILKEISVNRISQKRENVVCQ